MLLLLRRSATGSSSGVGGSADRRVARSSNLKPGDERPVLAGQTITGKRLDLPYAIDDSQAVPIFSVSRATAKGQGAYMALFAASRMKLATASGCAIMEAWLAVIESTVAFIRFAKNSWAGGGII